MDGSNDRMGRFEEQWRAWFSAEPRVDEDQLRRALPGRLPPRERSRTRTVWLAAAAGLVLALVGARAYHVLRAPARPQTVARATTVVHHLDENVVLFVSKDSEPVYILLGAGSARKGDLS